MATTMTNPRVSTTSPIPTKICVFCASSPGKNPGPHLAAARSLGETLAKYNIKLVYGGGVKGMMGEVARTLVKLSGPEAVQGVVPEALLNHEAHESQAAEHSTLQTKAEAMSPSLAAQWEDPIIQNANPSRISLDPEFGFQIVVKSMHVRKDTMAKLVDAAGLGSGFVGLTGGFGTLEEVAEMITWNQLGIHSKGVVLYNVEGYWNGLLQWVETAVGGGYVTEKNGKIVVAKEDAEGCVEALKEYQLSEDRLALKWNEK